MTGAGHSFKFRAVKTASKRLAFKVFHTFQVAWLGDGGAELGLNFFRLRFADFLFGLHLTFGHRFRLSVNEAGIAPSAECGP
ncbi:hypothetical protein HNE_2298 [Hyphomonas neptunium ATCC 15444]|uniref:Uncharacterized protein n=1 Tax=Hyphomonas neptunium (strain ATCC 15444) TaxID=228405 RepID=Q0BZV1_HYPNA|nr:hypothetical protein HNE_2298 [Hyphomonas neptunium ATCC 15444]